MNIIEIYPKTLEVDFSKRINRFVGEFRYRDSIIKVYMPNTGRMAEFLQPGREFYLIQKKSPKFDYRMIATRYQDAYVFLDTTRINKIFIKLLKLGKIKEFTDFRSVKEEVKYGNSRFDVEVIKKDGTKVVIELKSCTLCHNGVAMFPDAVTARGRKHIEELAKLAEKGIESHVYFLVLNENCNAFLPNLHTDLEFTRAFHNNPQVNFHALKIPFTQPNSYDADQIRYVPIALDIIQKNLKNRGSYILLLENRQDFQLEIGKLGKRSFKKGFYLYVGSALNSLSSRLKRHSSSRKKLHWHLDNILPFKMILQKKLIIRRSDRIETKIAAELQKIADSSVPGFGASDSSISSHLFYFRNDPYRTRDFWNVLLKYQTFTERGTH